MSAAVPLVSILLPAYRERFFAQALASALWQRWPALEVIVCDDSPGDAIERIVREAGDARVRYVRNPERLGFARNFSRCFELARGEFIKFLNDDDRLAPHCVDSLVRAMLANPSVRLATSRRSVIDDAGHVRPDIPATMPVSHVSALVFGRELGDLMLANSTNFVGEPTSVLFRKADVVPEDGLVFRWGARDYHCLADMSLWLRLLARGLAYYEAETLSEFRMHAGQEQRGPSMDLQCAQERLWISREARKCGYLSSPPLWAAALDAIIARAGVLRDDARYDALTRGRAAALADEARVEREAVGAAPGT
jgi:hypothetical protein